MNEKKLKVSVDDFLFGGGMRVEDYYVVQTPLSESVCYTSQGNDFDLHISDSELASAAIKRLKELDVRIFKLG
jgi:hypothetical protein